MFAKKRSLIITCLISLSIMCFSFLYLSIYSAFKNNQPPQPQPEAATSIKIGTVEQWNNYAANSGAYGDNSYKYSSFELTANLDFSGKTFKAFGVNAGFSGTFNGNGKTIKNITIDMSSSTLNHHRDAANNDYVGVFAYINGDAIIKDLNIINVKIKNITSDAYVGGAIGRASGGFNEDYEGYPSIYKISMADLSLEGKSGYNNDNVQVGFCGSALDTSFDMVYFDSVTTSNIKNYTNNGIALDHSDGGCSFSNAVAKGKVMYNNAGEKNTSAYSSCPARATWGGYISNSSTDGSAYWYWSTANNGWPIPYAVKPKEYIVTCGTGGTLTIGGNSSGTILANNSWTDMFRSSNFSTKENVLSVAGYTFTPRANDKYEFTGWTYANGADGSSTAIANFKPLTQILTFKMPTTLPTLCGLSCNKSGYGDSTNGYVFEVRIGNVIEVSAHDYEATSDKYVYTISFDAVVDSEDVSITITYKVDSDCLITDLNGASSSIGLENFKMSETATIIQPIVEYKDYGVGFG